MSAPTTRDLIWRLWPKGDEPDSPQVFALLDGARNNELAPWIRLKTLEYECLYRGHLSPRLANAAPYLVHLSRDHRFTRDLLEQAWGNSWGVFTRVESSVTLEQQYRHFRKLLLVKDESGRRLVFRFYDPRVLRVYFPTCTEEEAAQFFGPVTEFLAESEDARRLISFKRARGGVETEGIAV